MLASNLANALWLEDRLPEALTWARWATRQNDQQSVHPLAWRCLGNVLLDLGRFEEADQAYRKADPLARSAADQFNRSKVAWGQGDLARAWLLAEQRLHLRPLPDGVVPGPWWDGWPTVRQITVWAEQGFGDTLQFVRWLPPLMARGVSVELLVEPPLQRLLSSGLAWVGPGLQVVSRNPETSAAALSGCHGSLLSLPWRLACPQPPGWGCAEPYIRLGSTRSRRRSGRLRLGLLWGAGRYLDGRCRERDYRRKSVLGADLRSLLVGLAARPVDLINLQVGPDRERPELAGVLWADALNADGDFLDLAEQLLDLDLLISVDTAAAHLAGALGVQTWLLLPWAAASRWGRDGVHTPWYPSLRLWRQSRHGDWQGLWPHVLAALDQLCTSDLNSDS